MDENYNGEITETYTAFYTAKLVDRASKQTYMALYLLYIYIYIYIYIILCLGYIGTT